MVYTALRDVGIFRDELTIANVVLQFPRLSLTIRNHVTGHAIPASGGTRILALEVRLLDSEGKQAHEIVHTFGKRFALMPLSGLFPNRLIRNNQLQSDEARRLEFNLPSSLRGRIAEAEILLRFYSVSDEHQGDLSHAHWVSEPILKQAFRL